MATGREEQPQAKKTKEQPAAGGKRKLATGREEQPQAKKTKEQPAAGGKEQPKAEQTKDSGATGGKEQLPHVVKTIVKVQRSLTTGVGTVEATVTARDVTRPREKLEVARARYYLGTDAREVEVNPSECADAACASVEWREGMEFKVTVNAGISFPRAGPVATGGIVVEVDAYTRPINSRLQKPASGGKGTAPGSSSDGMPASGGTGQDSETDNTAAIPSGDYVSEPLDDSGED